MNKENILEIIKNLNDEDVIIINGKSKYIPSEDRFLTKKDFLELIEISSDFLNNNQKKNKTKNFIELGMHGILKKMFNENDPYIVNPKDFNEYYITNVEIFLKCKKKIYINELKKLLLNYLTEKKNYKIDFFKGNFNYELITKIITEWGHIKEAELEEISIKQKKDFIVINIPKNEYCIYEDILKISKDKNCDINSAYQIWIIQNNDFNYITLEITNKKLIYIINEQLKILLIDYILKNKNSKISSVLYHFFKDYSIQEQYFEEYKNFIQSDWYLLGYTELKFIEQNAYALRIYLESALISKPAYLIFLGLYDEPTELISDIDELKELISKTPDDKFLNLFDYKGLCQKYIGEVCRVFLNYDEYKSSKYYKNDNEIQNDTNAKYPFWIGKNNIGKKYSDFQYAIPLHLFCKHFFEKYDPLTQKYNPKIRKLEWKT